MSAYLTYINIIFNDNTRWVFFGALFIFLFSKKKLIRFWDPLLAFILFIYIIWCFLTSFWSDVYILSLAKSTMLSFVVITMITAGIEWVNTRHWEHSINYIGLLAYITLLAASLGKLDWSAAPTTSTEIAFYRGSFVTGSNMLGFYMAASLPFFIWKTYLEKVNTKKYFIRLLLVLACVYFLMASMSRGAIAATLATLMGFMFSLNLNKKVLLLSFLIFILTNLFVFYPDKIIDTVGRYIFKNAYSIKYSHELFASRKLAWQQSYDAAVEGGWLGLGYGASVGDTNFNFDYGLSSRHYGREKGNSQLAIVEETGMVGLILYSGLLIILIFKLYKLYTKVNNPSQRVLVGILFGTLIGMIIQSIFEGWWDAPAGPETIYFWLLVGIISGLEIAIGKRYAARII
ncbi:MAG TPA: O-antigen ligase family protein [Gammaproteobacteria bacterium]|nr:O-antigen ligase family protein [Gammaproteobacteria bacterium]